jgi:hypothetical protein
MTAKIDLTDLFDLFGKSVDRPPVAPPVSPEARKWSRTFAHHLATVMTVRGLPRDAAEKVAFENTVTEFLNSTHPDTDSTRCACCGRAETRDSILLPMGVGARHAWLHSGCPDPWAQSRREAAIETLAATGILMPSKDEAPR